MRRRLRLAIVLGGAVWGVVSGFAGVARAAGPIPETVDDALALGFERLVLRVVVRDRADLAPIASWVEPWEVDLNIYFIGLPFEITSHITDPGSDDETFTFTYGSQVKTVTYLNNPPDPDPYPSPEVNPVEIVDITTLTYEGAGTITLIVKDDDNIRLGVNQGSDSFYVA